MAAAIGTAGFLKMRDRLNGMSVLVVVTGNNEER